MMKHSEAQVTLADIEREARRLQAEAVSSMFRAAADRFRALFSSTPLNTGTGRTA